MKVSEKSLELNIGAEILGLMRGRWGMPKAYLRGLTQREEKQEGVDFFDKLNPTASIFAFQFKAPQGKVDAAHTNTISSESSTSYFFISRRNHLAAFFTCFRFT